MRLFFFWFCWPDIIKNFNRRKLWLSQACYFSSYDDEKKMIINLTLPHIQWCTKYVYILSHRRSIITDHLTSKLNFKTRLFETYWLIWLIPFKQCKNSYSSEKILGEYIRIGGSLNGTYSFRVQRSCARTK